MEKYLLNEKTGVICKEGTSEMDITLLGEIIEKEDKFVLEAIKENGEIVKAELSKEEYFNGKEFTIKIEKEEKKKENNILTIDIIIEVGQKFSDGHLIAYTEKENGVIEFLIDTEESEGKLFTYTTEEIIKLAKKYGVIKEKGLKLVNKENEIMEFDSVNEFYNHLLAETGKEKINKGLLYNLKNGKSKSCYGYRLFLEEEK
jgi:hypothetical protein